MKKTLIIGLLLSGSACSPASFDVSGLGGDDAASDTAETESPQPDTAIDAKVDAVDDDSRADATDALEAGDAHDAEIETGTPDVAPDSIAVDTTPDAPLSRCAGHGFGSGQLGLIVNPPSSRPTGYLAFAASRDSGTWQDPYPGCATSDISATTLACNVGSAGSVRFTVGVSVAVGGSLDATRPFVAKTAGGSFYAIGEYIACKGDLEIGSYTSSGGFSGKLAAASSLDAFVLTP